MILAVRRLTDYRTTLRYSLKTRPHDAARLHSVVVRCILSVGQEVHADCARSAPFTENLEASPALEVCGVTKMPSDEWIRTFADGRKVKFSHDELMDSTFITAQIAGNEVVYSILLNNAETKLSREEVEGRFEHELSKK
jgi:hypothetical protein